MTEPRPYDLSNTAELRRLLCELAGYMRVSLTDGTDAEGRAHAHAALVTLTTPSGFEQMVRTLAPPSLPRAHAGG